MATDVNLQAGAPRADGAAPVAPGTGFFGHPLGLATLFLTEFWERFTYYGMRGILVLFLTAETVRGGFGFSASRAAAIYGLYTGATYFACLPGGWIADRLLGQRRSVLVGGILIAAGNFLMVVPSQTFFFVGLLVICSGVGLLKPNVSTMVSELYPEGGARRDAGFSIFYSGINSGAFLAPLVCGWLGEKYNWRLGFLASGLGMVIGVFTYVVGRRPLGQAGMRPNAGADPVARAKALRVLALAGGLLLALVIVVVMFHVTPEVIAGSALFLTAALAVFYFLFQMAAGGLDATEKKRMIAVFALFIFTTTFWAGYEQTGSSLNLFSEKLTNRMILGWEMPASWLQSVNPLFVILLAPVFAWLWLRLGRHNPSSPVKFALGLLLLGLGFIVMVVASRASVGTVTYGPGVVPRLVSPMWLVLTYLLHSLGELALSPVGLSTVTKLAPYRKVSQMMGIWFLSISLGNLIAGRVAGDFNSVPLYQIFGFVAVASLAAGIVLLFVAKPIKNLMSGVQ